MLREDDGQAKRDPQETKGELSREDVHDILQGMQDLRGWPAVVDSQRARSADAHPTEQRQGNASGGLASVGDRQNQDKRKGKAEHRLSAFAALIVFDKVGKPTERNRPEARGQAGGTAWQNRTIWYNGT